MILCSLLRVRNQLVHHQPAVYVINDICVYMFRVQKSQTVGR
jgi:hypothetical protein